MVADPALALFIGGQLNNRAHSCIIESISAGAMTVRAKYAAMIDNSVIPTLVQPLEFLCWLDRTRRVQ